jgi:hypothetical protein
MMSPRRFLCGFFVVDRQSAIYSGKPAILRLPDAFRKQVAGPRPKIRRFHNLAHPITTWHIKVKENEAAGKGNGS